MGLTACDVKKYVGGHAVIRNRAENITCCGKISDIIVENGVLHLRLASCMKKGEEGGWAQTELSRKATPLLICESSRSLLKEGLLYLDSSRTAEEITFFPPGRNMFGVTEMEQLELAQSEVGEKP